MAADETQTGGGRATAQAPAAERVRPALRALAAEVSRRPLCLVVAPGGSGKTTLLEAWSAELRAAGTPVAWLPLSPLHDDVARFLEDLIGAVREAAGDAGFGAGLLRDLPHIERPDVRPLARRLAAACRALPAPVCVFLDNYHLLARDAPAVPLVDALLRDGVPALRFAIASRGARPLAAARLLAGDDALLVDAEALSLRAGEVESLLADRGLEAGIVPQLLAQTEGWVTGVLLATRALERLPPDRHAGFVSALGAERDLFEYVAGELIADEPPELVWLLEIAAVLGPSHEATLVAAADDAGAILRIEEALAKGLLLRSGERMAPHHMWESFLLRRLRARLSSSAWRALHVRLAGVVAAADPERSLWICAEGGADLELRGLLERHGRDWLALGRHRTVEEALARIPEPERNASPALAHLDALALRRTDTEASLARLEAVADRYRAADDRTGEAAALHDALIVAANENRRDAYARILRRMVPLRRIVSDPRVRALSVTALAALCAQSRRFRLAERLLRGVNRDVLGPSERGAVVIALALIGCHRSWDRALDVLEEAFGDASQRAHAPSFYLFQVQRALVRGLRGVDPEGSLGEAQDAQEAFREFRLTASELLAAETTGQLLSRAGRHREALAAFDRALHLAERSGQWDFEAALHGLRARERFLLDERIAACADARQAMSLYDAHRRDRASFFFRAAVAARVRAECGEAEEALAFARRHERRIRTRELPLAHHAAQLMLARVAELAGDAGSHRRHLDEARIAAANVPAGDRAGDLDAPLLAWAGDPTTLDATPDVRAHEPWRVVTLGGLTLYRDGRRLPRSAWRGITTRRLFLRLLVAGSAGVRREVLELEFWPESPPDRARANLRVALSRLRGVLEGAGIAGGLESDGDLLRLADFLCAASDVSRLHALLERASRCAGDASLALRREALSLYAGAFAPELYDDWAESERLALETRFTRSAERTAADLLAAGRPDEARSVAEQLVDRVPSHEAGWVLLARSALAAGDRPGAQRTLVRARDVMRVELELDPGPELRDLERELRRA